MKGILFLIGLTLGLITGLGIAVYRYESKKNNNVNKAIYYYEKKEKIEKSGWFIWKAIIVIEVKNGKIWYIKSGD